MPPAAGMDGMAGGGGTELYDVLGVARGARNIEIRRAYRNLITREHPDKGGDPERFARIQRAYDVLSNDAKRRQYDATGTTEKTVDEQFMEGFAAGAFQDKLRVHAEDQREKRESVAEQLTVRQTAEFNSHTAGFEAWMRSRGEGGGKVYTADDIVEQFGVAEGSYEPVPLPKIKAYAAECRAFGNPRDALGLTSQPIPAALEWGEILVNIRAAPINPGDVAAVGAAEAGTGGRPGPPFVGGSAAVAIVVKVGPGVKNVHENDWVLPFRPDLGAWRSLAVWKEKDVLKVPAELMPLEYLAMHQEMCVAYRLLEDFGALQPGDAVALNAATSAVGQTVIQLCSILKLRVVAVARDLGGNFAKTATWLKSLGASAVLKDAGDLKEELGELKFFAKPKLAFDCVGGASARRLADTLEAGGQLVVYGCLSGEAPQWGWEQWVHRELKVCGFNMQRWMDGNKKRIPAMLESLATLVNADKLRLNYTEYELSTEFDEALDHALEDGKGTKIVLKVNDIGNTYGDENDP